MSEHSQKQRIKILYIITLSEIGGAQKHLFYHLKYLDKSIYEPVLTAGQAGWLLKQAEAMGIKTYHCKSLIRSINPFNDLKAVYDMLKIIKSEKPDIVHCHSSKAGILGRIAAWIRGVPIIMFTAHGWAFTEGVNNKVRPIYRVIETQIAKITTKIITVSDYDWRLACSYAGINERKMVVIKNGIDFPEEFTHEIRKKFRAECGLDDSEIVITMVSRLSPQKDPYSFLKLAGLLKHNKTVFLLVGDGPQRNNIEDILKHMNIKNFRLIGYREDINDILIASDIFCFFSNYEGLPLALIEAMAAGLPIIANPVGGISEAVNDGLNGFLVNRHDLPSIMTKLQRLVDDESLRKQMGQESKRMYIDMFKARQMVNKTENIYKELIANKFSS